MLVRKFNFKDLMDMGFTLLSDSEVHCRVGIIIFIRR